MSNAEEKENLEYNFYSNYKYDRPSIESMKSLHPHFVNFLREFIRITTVVGAYRLFNIYNKVFKVFLTDHEFNKVITELVKEGLVVKINLTQNDIHQLILPHLKIEQQIASKAINFISLDPSVIRKQKIKKILDDM